MGKRREVKRVGDDFVSLLEMTKRKLVEDQNLRVSDSAVSDKIARDYFKMMQELEYTKSRREKRLNILK